MAIKEKLAALFEKRKKEKAKEQENNESLGADSHVGDKNIDFGELEKAQPKSADKKQLLYKFGILKKDKK